MSWLSKKVLPLKPVHHCLFEFASAAKAWPTPLICDMFCSLVADLRAVESAGSIRPIRRATMESDEPMNPRMMPATDMAPPVRRPCELFIFDLAMNPQIIAGMPAKNMRTNDSSPRTSAAIARPDVFAGPLFCGCVFCCLWIGGAVGGGVVGWSLF